MSMKVNYKITRIAHFGQVVGDIAVSVQAIRTDGHEEIANALKGLTEAIVDASDLNEEQKADAVGRIRELSRQVTMDKDSGMTEQSEPS